MLARAATVADVFRPSRRQLAFFYDVVLVLTGSVIIAASARLVLWLPCSLVPVTGQTFAVLLVGALFGARRGALCVAAYLAEGAMGIPVSASGVVGYAWLAGPTCGYLFGFVVAAYLVGWLAQRGWDRRMGTTVVAMLLGNICIYTFGLLWLFCLAVAAQQGIDFGKTLSVGLYPFIVGDVAKTLLAAIVLPSGWKLLSLFGLQGRADKTNV